MSQVSETVKMYYCQFLHNKNYEGHGTAIYFSPSNDFREDTKLIFTINNCNFSNNG